MTDPANDPSTGSATGASGDVDRVDVGGAVDAGNAVDDVQAVDGEAADEAVMAMLHEHVPLSLILDLTTPEGPDSASILAEEGQPEDAWWVQS